MHVNCAYITSSNKSTCIKCCYEQATPTISPPPPEKRTLEKHAINGTKKRKKKIEFSVISNHRIRKSSSDLVIT